MSRKQGQIVQKPGHHSKGNGMTRLVDLAKVYGRIGLLSFGGPAAQIALMQEELVEKRGWLTEDQYLRALSFCMLLPGPEAMQLATYAGWRQRGIAGGLIGGGLFVLPGAVVITVLALLYAAYGNLPIVQAVFRGVQATVVVIVIAALIKLSRKALTSQRSLVIAVVAFIALYIFALPFPVVIGCAAIWAAVGVEKAQVAPPSQTLPWHRSLMVLGVGLPIWLAPLVLIHSADPILTDIALFFAWLAVVTFGGAYAVLAYMTQAIVDDFGWLTTVQMMDALGLAETTPGPLILVTQFVGTLTALQTGGVMFGLLAGALVLWMTFVPCFIWIFAGAPLIDWLADQPRLRAALSGVTAAVVGVIANLSLWFALQVFFSDVGLVTAGPAQARYPHWASVDPLAIALACGAAYLLIWRKLPLLTVLAVTAALSGGVFLIP